MRRNGFSLVELMITVAIIGILAAIAIPNFQRQQLLARRSEAVTNLRGIGAAEQAYHLTEDKWLEAVSNPDDGLDKSLKTWNPTKAGWSDLGFKPDGKVRCNYVVQCFGGASSGDCASTASYARPNATCDVDNDNNSYSIRLYVDNDAASCCSGNPPGAFVTTTGHRF